MLMESVMATQMVKRRWQLRDLDSGFSSGTVSFVTLAKFLHLTLLTYKMGRIKSAFCTSQGCNRGAK